MTLAGIDPNTRNHLRALIESLEGDDDAARSKALAALESDAQAREFMNLRYLEFIRMRLGPSAMLAQLPEARYSPDETTVIHRFFDNRSVADFTGFTNEESRLVVDLIGALVKPHVDIDALIDKARQAKSTAELFDSVNPSQIRKGLKLQEKIDAPWSKWFGALVGRVGGHPRPIRFDNTAFELANESPRLRECMFFLFSDGVRVDIVNSEVPELTACFWLSEIPETHWKGVEPKFPEAPFSFERFAPTFVEDGNLVQVSSRPGGMNWRSV